MIIVPKNKVIWFIWQLGVLVLAPLITMLFATLIIAVAARAILPSLGVPATPGDHWIFVALGAVAALAILILRREYWFINRFEFTQDRMVVRTLLGVERVYPTSEYAFVPTLHKTVNWPQGRATLSFHVRRIDTAKNIRNFGWFGFARDDFAEVSRFYGYDGNTDFNVFGKLR